MSSTASWPNRIASFWNSKASKMSSVELQSGISNRSYVFIKLSSIFQKTFKKHSYILSKLKINLPESNQDIAVKLVRAILSLSLWSKPIITSKQNKNIVLSDGSDWLHLQNFNSHCEHETKIQWIKTMNNDAHREIKKKHLHKTAKIPFHFQALLRQVQKN